MDMAVAGELGSRRECRQGTLLGPVDLGHTHVSVPVATE
jgi:hypothetical protein